VSNDHHQINYATIDAPRGKKHGTSVPRAAGQLAQPGPDTDLSVVNGGTHINVYTSKTVMEVITTWKKGIRVQWKLLNGTAALIVLKPAIGKGYTLRASRPGQRPHVCIPTGHVGMANPGFEMGVAETWLDGDTVVIKVPTGLFPEASHE
jgi:hypothetical protein